MTTLLKLSAILFLALYFTACAPGSTSAPTQADAVIDPGTSPNLVVSPTPAPSVPTSTVSLTYYKLSQTSAPINGWVNKTVTLTGMCVTYLTNEYCWDDGVQTIASWTSMSYTYGPFNYLFWGLNGSGNNITASGCSGSCATSDFMAAPKLVDTPLLNDLTSAKVNQVFNSGVAVPVTCTVSATQLNCVDFVIDLTQTPY